MATKTIIDGCFYVCEGNVTITSTDITADTIVEIFSSKIDYNYDDALIEIPNITSKGALPEADTNDDEPVTRIVDLKRIKEGINVQGVLEDETGETSRTKMNNLLDLAKRKGVLIIVWGTGADQTVWKPFVDPKDGTGVFIKKMMFTQTAGVYGDTSTFLRKIDIQIQFVRGLGM